MIERERVHEESPVTDGAEPEAALAGVGVAAPDFD